jgi:hypothetical protein
VTALEPLLRKWRAFDKWLLQEVAVKPVFAWFDLWVGFYVDRHKRRLYVLPLPCVGFYIQFEENWDPEPTDYEKWLARTREREAAVEAAKEEA